MVATEVQVRYVRTVDSVRIAFAVHGDGPPLILVRGMNSHVEQMWTTGRNRRYLRALAAGTSVITYDARGNGMSDACTDFSTEALVSDLDAVLAGARVERVIVYGQGYGTPIALAFAARRPDVVDRLVLYAPFASGEQVAIPDAFVRQMRDMPDAALALMARLSYPDADAVPANLMRRDAFYMEPVAAAAFLEYLQRVDLTDELASIRAPTLVMQPERRPAIPVRAGTAVAAAIAGARLEYVPSGAYNPWAPESVAPTLRAVGRFCGIELPVAVPESQAVLATDTVASTERAHRLGEARARELLEIHDRVVRSILRETGGREVKHMGDGILALFDSTAQALEAALAIQGRLVEERRVLPETGDVRVGVSCGDVLIEEHDIHGTTVVLAVRLADAGDAGDVLVTQAVRRSTEAAPYAFGERRSVRLKGFPDPVGTYPMLGRA